MTRKSALFVAALVTGMLVTVAAAASSTGLFDRERAERAGVQLATSVAEETGVTEPRPVAISASGRAAVVAGERANADVVAFAIAGGSTEFRDRSQLLGQRGIAAQVGWGGDSPGRVDHGSVAGVVSSGVKSLRLVTKDGELAIPIADGAFAFDLEGSFAGGQLVASGANGDEVGSFEIHALQPAG